MQFQRVSSITASIARAFSSFSDNFQRTTTTSLGVSSSHGLWKVLRGTWFANGTTAQTQGLPTDYPMSVVPMRNANTTTSVTGVGNGVGAAFWVTDANNWWAITQNRHDVANVGATYYAGNYYAGYYYGGGSNYNCVIGHVEQRYYYTYTPGPYYPGYSYQAPGTVNGPFPGGQVFVCDYGFTQYSPPVYSAPSYTPPSYYAGVTQNNYSLVLRQSVNGVVTTIATQALTSLAQAIRVVTNNLGITANAYTDTSFTASAGTALTYTATGFIPDKKVGIILAPSEAGQNYTASTFTAQN